MRGEQLELEDLAREIRRRAGLSEGELVSSLTIAHRVLGLPVRVLPSLPTSATIVAVEGRYRILIRELEREAHFGVAHELGHWALREIAGYRGAKEEAFANRIAGAIVVPAVVVRDAVGVLGRMFGAVAPLAEATGTSQTAANLRLGEVLEDERAVLTGHRKNLLVTAGRHSWDRALVIRFVAGEVETPGLAKAPLRGGLDDNRFALKAK